MLSTEEPARRPHIMASVGARSLNRRAHHLPSKIPIAYPLDPYATMQHIWILTGPAGSGKTTVARGLAKEFGLPYIEGDDYHSKSNKDKMANNVPLTDADRWDWLIQLREAAISSLESKNSPAGVIVTCSALKHKYRDVIRVAAYDHPSVRIHFIYLRADEQILLQRVKQRKGHYMKSDMVQSQLENLEEPDSEWDAISVDCAASLPEVQRRVNVAVQNKLDEYK
ncbi:carbohydrate kinase, thermoresistant glucokinase family protein [Coccidioides posadasii C735 delta SOWgp]|uniref:Gluconokinase n=1 Tax=Coccidioides posadasii (strain C735) TaxID=222929 RepID=C5PG20_COCP7|nr:carbohydrate kinase, thermoresistant glucokinase family protein [Coccidioides posadasii C735 delta SOWgp]EER23473.1 carbohydrate kinase, thermoresistant glucokinase family protein [Coccidioides posadasii C735 delta SOWgp]|eukprot:XP_003065618.1 carbohydrate kinase, thermoresistant glucokinase family protein [Coccidioides posadasii C735 delta SOWgp]